MARKINRLSAMGVAKLQAGRHADGAGLYLQVESKDAKSWIYRYTFGTSRNGKPREREMGLGSLGTLSLAGAREEAARCRELVLKGTDPIEARKANDAAKALRDARSMTFDQCRDVYIAAHESDWRNPKHRQQWKNTLETYVTPIFGKLPVQSIDKTLVLKVLDPIWNTKTETASRIRQRIEVILRWAKARGYREGENPASLESLEGALPKKPKKKRVKHHPALAYLQMGDFMAKLREHNSMAACALEFIVLTVARSANGRGARWLEIAGDGNKWTVPGPQMKGGRDHRVPLSAQARAVLDRAKTWKRAGSDLVFPGTEANTPISETAIRKLLGNMGFAHVTIHGFRSTFRDWMAERTSFPNELGEMALAHTVPDEVEAAYRRGDMFDKRVKLMQAWSDYCDGADRDELGDKILRFGKAS